MILSTALSNVLTKCGQDIYIDNEVFEKIILCEWNEYLDNNIHQDVAIDFDDKFNNHYEAKELKGSSHVQYYQYAVATLLIESSKQNNDSSTFDSILGELNWSKSRIEAIKKLYKEVRPVIRIKLLSTCTFPPQIVDVNWKVSVIRKDTASATTGSICYMITFHTETTDGKREPITFRCSTAQLTHLVTRLRQASRFVNKYAAASL